MVNRWNWIVWPWKEKIVWEKSLYSCTCCTEIDYFCLVTTSRSVLDVVKISLKSFIKQGRSQCKSRLIEMINLVWTKRPYSPLQKSWKISSKHGNSNWIHLQKWKITLFSSQILPQSWQRDVCRSARFEWYWNNTLIIQIKGIILIPLQNKWKAEREGKNSILGKYSTSHKNRKSSS